MPLETARHFPFRYNVILANAPRESGVYALFKDREPLYVEEADSIYVGLLHYFEQGNGALPAERPTAFAFETCTPERRKGRLVQSVFRLQPAHTERSELKAHEG